MSDETDRPRGILTPENRQFLRGEREHISQGSKYNQRARIHERLAQAILDFPLIFDRLPPVDRKRAFSDLDEAGSVTSIAAAISVLYEASKHMDTAFEIPVELGIRQAERARIDEDEPLAPAIDVEVEPFKIVRRSRREPIVDDVVEKVKSGSRMRDLTDAEVRELAEWYERADEFDPEIASREYRRFREPLGETGVESDDSDEE